MGIVNFPSFYSESISRTYPINYITHLHTSIMEKGSPMYAQKATPVAQPVQVQNPIQVGANPNVMMQPQAGAANITMPPQDLEAMLLSRRPLRKIMTPFLIIVIISLFFWFPVWPLDLLMIAIACVGFYATNPSRIPSPGWASAVHIMSIIAVIFQIMGLCLWFLAALVVAGVLSSWDYYNDYYNTYRYDWGVSTGVAVAWLIVGLVGAIVITVMLFRIIKMSKAFKKELYAMSPQVGNRVVVVTQQVQHV